MHTNDRWTGRPFKLLPWQKMVILCLFVIDATGLRRIRWALIGIAKKNGKTELAAALACFFAFGPSGPDGQAEPSALVVCAAGNDAQADLVFGAAKRMCELSPTLRLITETFESEILCPSLPGSMIVRVAAAAKKTSSTLDGPNIYVVICDELHCWEGNGARVVWNTLTNGGVTRRQPLILQITTAGFDEDSICGEQYAYGKAVAAGEVVDDAYFFWWVEAPERSDHRDPAVIIAANPSFGLVMQMSFYLDQLTKKTEAIFRRYFLNMWTEAEETWLGAGTWEALSIGAFEFDAELDLYGMTDAATKHDSTAHVLGQWHDCRQGCPGWSESVGDVRKLRMKAKIWERPFDARTRRPLEGWKLPIAEVEQWSRDVHRLCHLKAWGYDPALYERSAQQLEAEGLPMEEVPQTDSRMVPAAQMLFQLVNEGLVEHDGAVDFARHLKNAVAVQARGGDGGWRLKKGASGKKMDAAIGAAGVALLATAVDEDESTPPPATSRAATTTSTEMFRPTRRLRL